MHWSDNVRANFLYWVLHSNKASMPALHALAWRTVRFYMVITTTMQRYLATISHSLYFNRYLPTQEAEQVLLLSL
nr:MAG TPA: hypothetical protein [Caudoviricetes sp.]